MTDPRETCLKALDSCLPVLEVGSGPTPHWRSTTLGDLYIWGHDNQDRQSELDFRRDGRPVVNCNLALALPFKDQAFPFVFAIHILEHLVDPLRGCQELWRVAPQGYVEVPSAMRELWWPAGDMHRWVCQPIPTYEHPEGIRFVRKPPKVLNAFTEWEPWLNDLYYAEQYHYKFNIGIHWHGSFPVEVITDY